jgi:D-aminoacyl-tRNA deacylase
MKVLIQRVKQASVQVEGEVVGAIKKGLLVFIGIHKDDTEDLIPYLVKKILELRVFSDEKDKMNLSLQDINGEALVVSQFTLYADCQTSGRRPGFSNSAPPEKAQKMIEEFIKQMKEKISKVSTGIFAAKMEVSLINDGPATFIIEKAS